MPMPAREEMLSKIKAALNIQAPQKSLSLSSEQPDQIRRRCVEQRERLIEQFEAELTRVGVHLFRADSVAAASEYLERVALASDAKRMIGWDSPLIDKIVETVALEKTNELEKIGVEFLRDRAGDTASDIISADFISTDFISAAIESEIGITTVDYALADTGTLVLISGAGRARSASLVPPVHVAVVEARQIISGLDDLFPLLAENSGGADQKMASAITFITGPSRTADIELTLVVGVHGPQQLHVILIADQQY